MTSGARTSAFRAQELVIAKEHDEENTFNSHAGGTGKRDANAIKTLKATADMGLRAL